MATKRTWWGVYEQGTISSEDLQVFCSPAIDKATTQIMSRLAPLKF
jgi:hypothetical protein